MSKVLNSKKEFFVASLTFLLIIFIFNFPTYFAWKNTPPGKVFSGQAFWFDSWDVNVYVSAIRWSQKFGLNFQNSYTTTPHKSTVLYPFYTTLGMLFPKTNPFILYHASLLTLSFFLLLVIYSISKKFLDSKNQALLATILISLGGGFGWMLYPKILLPDIAITPFTFTGTFQRPHEVLAMVFYFTALHLFYLSVSKNNKILTLISSISACLLVFFYPFYLLSYYFICFLFTIFVFKTKAAKYWKHFIIILATFPIGFLYSFYILSADAFKNVLSPNLPTPNFLSLALGYGILTPFLLYQLFLMKNKSKKTIFLNTWFFISVILAYFPLSFSKYYLRGLFLPAILLTFLSIKIVATKLKTYWLKRVLVIFLPLISLFIFSARLLTTIQGINKWYYISREEHEAVQFLNQNSQPGSGVIVNRCVLSNQIPALTTNRVYFGHYYQTPNSEEKILNLEKFYTSEFSSEESKEFLRNNNIIFVVDLKNDKDTITSELKYDFLKNEFHNSEVNLHSFDSHAP